MRLKRTDIAVTIRDAINKDDGWLQYLPAADAIIRIDQIFEANAALLVKPNAWRYQRKEGWGDVWRVSDVDPATDGFFETPGDWNVEPLYAERSK